MDLIWQLLDASKLLITYGFSEEGFRAHNEYPEYH